METVEDNYFITTDAPNPTYEAIMEDELKQDKPSAEIFMPNVATANTEVNVVNFATERDLEKSVEDVFFMRDTLNQSMYAKF